MFRELQPLFWTSPNRNAQYLPIAIKLLRLFYRLELEALEPLNDIKPHTKFRAEKKTECGTASSNLETLWQFKILYMHYAAK